MLPVPKAVFGHILDNLFAKSFMLFIGQVSDEIFMRLRSVFLWKALKDLTLFNLNYKVEIVIR